MTTVANVHAMTRARRSRRATPSTASSSKAPARGFAEASSARARGFETRARASSGPEPGRGRGPVVVCHSFEPSAKSIAWTHRPVVTHHITTTRRSCLRFLRYPSNELEYVFFSRNTPSHDADADSATTARPVVETRRRPRSRDRRSTRDDDRRERSRDDARAPFATRDAVHRIVFERALARVRGRLARARERIRRSRARLLGTGTGGRHRQLR